MSQIHLKFELAITIIFIYGYGSRRWEQKKGAQFLPSTSLFSPQTLDFVNSNLEWHQVGKVGGNIQVPHSSVLLFFPGAIFA